jgi:hypothetical protein
MAGATNGESPMGVKAILTADQFNEQPEDVKALYKQNGDKYVLDVDDIDAHPKVATLKAAHERVKKNAKALRDFAQGRDVDETSIDDDQTKTALEKLKTRFDFLPEDFDGEAFEALKKAADGKGGQVTEEQIAEIRERITAKLDKKYGEKHTAEVEPLRAENEKLKGSVSKLVIDGGLAAAMDAADIDPKHKSMLLPALKARGKIRVEEDEDGDLRPVVETDMGAVPLRDWVSEFAGSDEGSPYVVKPTGPAPNGNNGQRVTGKTMKRSAFDALDGAARNKVAMEGVQIVD